MYAIVNRMSPQTNVEDGVPFIELKSTTSERTTVRKTFRNSRDDYGFRD